MQRLIPLICGLGGIGQTKHDEVHSFCTIEADGGVLVKATCYKMRRKQEISWTDGGKMVEYGGKACYNMILAHMILESPFLSDEV